MIDNDVIRRETKERYLNNFTPGSLPHGFVYSGNVTGAVLASLYLKGTVPILHGSIGCALHFRYIPRKGNLILDELICTDLAETDFIRGGSDKLRYTIRRTYAQYRPERILIIPTSPILVITDDIQLVLSELEVELGCDLIYANITTIAQAVEHRYLGCGYVEVFKAYLDRYAPSLPRDDKLLVIGGGLSYRKDPPVRTLIDNIREELGEFGLKFLDMTGPLDTERLAQVPAAAYATSIFLHGCECALEQRYGIKLFPEEMDSYLWDGLAGLEQYYLGIIRLFNLGPEAEAKIVLRKQQVQRRLYDAGYTFCEKSYALCASYPWMIYWIARATHGLLNMPLKYILLTMRDIVMHRQDLTQTEIEEIVQRNMEEVREKLGYEPILLIDPTPEQIAQVAAEVDYFIGRDCFPAIHDVQRWVTPLPNRPNGFSDYEDYLINYATMLAENNRVPNQWLLKDRLDALEDKNTSVSYQMKSCAWRK